VLNHENLFYVQNAFNHQRWQQLVHANRHYHRVVINYSWIGFLTLMIPMISQSEQVIQVDMEPLMITGTRLLTPSDPLAASTVIQHDDWEQQQASSLVDVLRNQSGVIVRQPGGAGQPASVQLRGAETDHTLVLLDGVQINSPTLGVAPWEQLPLDGIQRIEIVRGPASSLYGSEALGGVIQLFTNRDWSTSTPQVQLRTTVGSDDHKESTAHLAIGAGSHWWLQAYLGATRAGGFDACSGEPGVGGCFVKEPDRDRHTSNYALLSTHYEPNSTLALDLRYLRTAASTDYDGNLWSGNRNRTLFQTISTQAQWQYQPHWSMQWTVAYTKNRSLIDFNQQERDYFITEQQSATWQHDITIQPRHQLAFGIDYQRDTIDTRLPYTENTRHNTGLFTNYVTSWHQHDLQLGMRYDDNSQFGQQTTGQIRWGWWLTPSLQWVASYGTAFKAPTFNELYYPGFGNPDLHPECAWSADVGFNGSLDWGTWSAHLYQLDIDDLIAFDALTARPENLDTARIRGVELSSEIQIAQWVATAHLDFLDARNQTAGAYHGRHLARRPDQTARLDIHRNFGSWHVGATWFVAGSSYDDFANQQRLDGYQLLDLRVEKSLGSHWRLQGRIENTLNQHYETAAYYNQPERRLFLTVRWQNK
jgi:vitamin B12 transporter